jgi:hypothetical protein
MMQTAVLLIPFDITVVATVRDQGYLFVLIKHLIGYIKIYLVYMNWDVLEIYKSKSPLNSICDDGFFRNKSYFKCKYNSSSPISQ